MNSLQIKKYRDLHRLFVVEGVKLVEELIHQHQFKIDGIFHTAAYQGDLPEQLHTFQITDAELERISGLKAPNQVLAVVKYPNEIAIDYSEENLVLVLDNINDPGNLGTIIRTADWFGIKQIIASKITVDLFNPKVIQSSMGAVYRVQFFRTDLKDTLLKLNANGFAIMGAELGGENLFEATFPKKTALVMGSESHGISEDLQHHIQKSILIPKFGDTESLNVAMATGILLSYYRKAIG